MCELIGVKQHCGPVNKLHEFRAGLLCKQNYSNPHCKWGLLAKCTDF